MNARSSSMAAISVQAALALVVIASSGCSGRAGERPCESGAECVIGERMGACVPSPLSSDRWCVYPDESCPGDERWSPLAGDGLADTCVEPVPDSGVDAPVAVDAGPDASPDATPADAGPPDGPPILPPLTTGQAADLVLGQPNFTSSTGDNTSPTLTVLYWPWGVASDGTRLWVSDGGNARVLQWSGLPITNQQAASHVIGQAGIGFNMSGTTQSQIAAGDLRVYSDGTRVYVSDSTNNRVLIWNAVPTSSGANASVVLGQTSFTTATSGNGASNLNYPIGLWSDGTRLIVADTGNNRVLIWNTIPTVNGEAADVVVGQAGFGVGTVGPIGAASLSGPRDVFYDGVRLFVTDPGRHRVLVWNGIPAANGEAADYLIGQSSFTDTLPNAGSPGPNAAGFNSPVGLQVDRDSLFVSDNANNRVLVFTPVPTATGALASVALGQPDLTSGTMGKTSNVTIGGPGGLASDGDHLWVVDFDWHRVLRYSFSP